MCVADLNASNLPCGHSWYRLQRPCSPGKNLHTCTRRIALEGWEVKCDFCPFCSGWPVNLGEFVLLGSNVRRSSSIHSGNSPLVRTSSMSTTVSSARRDSKASALSRTSSSGSITAVPVPTAMPSSPVWNAGERNKNMKNRFDSYITSFHDRPVSGAATPRSRGGSTAGEYSDEDAGLTRQRTNSDSNDDSLAEMPTFPRSFSKGWSNAKRKSKDLSSFFR